MSTQQLSPAEKFFYAHACYAFPVDASARQIEQARVRVAKELAAAEQWVQDGPFLVRVQPDELAEQQRPCWLVGLYSTEQPGEPQLVGTSVGVVVPDENDPYVRVVAAELAAQYLSEH